MHILVNVGLKTSTKTNIKNRWN